ncbi:LamG-like jellyroll fold domain-containing protein [Pontibacter sp. SGAir0037]|uniref:LamG-like jellyroll fold domain-containing protein n=1 Tax=Pontibacter sp. SGAir0037 TaxID=2571030 RepID=UPI0010CCB7FD|nr:LamG-like jellyroll fold domain-containing protein [Pontibacter sp. SGAir0037]QCR22822.1 hypothetical protein C1N53_11030 [Pontibacter sp. SGAir0037]
MIKTMYTWCRLAKSRKRLEKKEEVTGAISPYRSSHIFLSLLLTLICYSTPKANAANVGSSFNKLVTEPEVSVEEAMLLAETPCPDNLVHHFGLDEKESGAYLDYKGAANPSCTNCPTPVEGLFDGAQQFNGKGNSITINEIQNFEWGPNSNFTIEFWVKTTGTSSEEQVIIGRSASDSQFRWWVGIDAAGNTVFEMYDAMGIGFRMLERDVKINDGRWHHVAVVRDGINLMNKLYIDGYKVEESKFTYKGNFESNSPVSIGSMSLLNRYFFSGTLDEVMVYKRALGENEMRARYNNGAGSYCGPQNVKPVIMSAPILFGVEGQPYIYDVQAVGTPAVQHELVAAPAGMTINAGTGEINWTPTTAGSFDVVVRVRNAVGQAEQAFKIEVKAGMGEKAGLTHHWMLHEIMGTRYKDFYTPYDAICDEPAKPTPITGVVSGGQRFNGTDQGLDVSNSSNFNWQSNDSFTIELWMRSSSDEGENRVIIGRDASDSEMHWWLGMDDKGFARFVLLDIGWQGNYIGDTGPLLTDGRWHQLVAVRDAGASATRLYVDGQKIKEGNFTYPNSFASMSPVNIGYLNLPGGYHYEGDLDEVKLFGRALSDAEIAERFETVYNNIVELIRFEGSYGNKVVTLEWETQTELDIAHFVVERSEDGVTFTEIGTVESLGPSNSNLNYKFTDTEPVQGDGFYRLKIVKESGYATYSNIILVSFKGLISSTFYLYPNPIMAGGEVKIEVDNLEPDAKAILLVSDLAGKRLLQEDITIGADGTLNLLLPLPTTIRPGIYNISVMTDVKTISRRLIVAQ